LRRAADLASAWAEPDGAVDYAQTGLSINVSMLDHTRRGRRLGRAVETPPKLSWGGLTVVTGDIWENADANSVISVEISRWRADIRHGVSISSNERVLRPGGQGDRSGQSEIILWPTEDEQRFEIRCDSSASQIRVTNAYQVGGDNWSRIERWTENAGLWVDSISERRRVYHCNYYSSAPPTFVDLVFTMSVDGI
jgi:hypothetical protein